MGTILRETDKSIVLSVTDPTWAAADESVLQTQLGMVAVSNVTQGECISGYYFVPDYLCRGFEYDDAAMTL